MAASAIGGARNRLVRLEPFAFDALIAGLFAIAGVIELLFIADRELVGSNLGIGIVLSLAQATGLAFRRRAPWVMVVLVFGALFGLAVGGKVLDTLGVPFVAMLWTFYSLGRWQERLMPIVVTSVAAALASLVAVAGVGPTLGGGFLFAAPVLVGRAVRTRTGLNSRLRAAVQRIETGRRGQAENAVGEERERIAGELQAVVANGVSVIVAQAEAVPRLLASGESAAASASLGVIEETGRDALAEMRRLLGVLRRDGEGADRRPLPSLSALDDLVARFGAGDLEAGVSVHGTRRELSSGVELAIYRLIERGFEAALEAGAEHAQARIVFGERDVSAEVVDDRSARISSSDYRAIQERIRIYDGHLRSGWGEGGFAVLVRLPMGAVA